MPSTLFDQLYFFGDSISDTGNIFNLTGGQFPPSPPYAPGRFSNGDIWIDYLADELNLTIDPFFSASGNNDGLNFSVGGATSGDDNIGEGFPGLEQQLDAFGLIAQTLPETEVFSDDLFFLWIGSNDYLSLIDDDLNTPDLVENNIPQRGRDIKELVNEVVNDNIAEAIEDMIAYGAANIFLFNLPDLETTPLGQSLEGKDRQNLQRIVRTHNRELTQLVRETERDHPNVDLIYVDTNRLLDTLLVEPDRFGFTNTTDNYIGFDLYTGAFQPPASGDPNEYVFWDSVHPSSATHSLVADLVGDRLYQEGFIHEDFV